MRPSRPRLRHAVGPFSWYDTRQVLDGASRALRVENLDAHFVRVRSSFGAPPRTRPVSVCALKGGLTRRIVVSDRRIAPGRLAESGNPSAHPSRAKMVPHLLRSGRWEERLNVRRSESVSRPLASPLQTHESPGPGPLHLATVLDLATVLAPPVGEAHDSLSLAEMLGRLRSSDRPE